MPLASVSLDKFNVTDIAWLDAYGQKIDSLTGDRRPLTSSWFSANFFSPRYQLYFSDVAVVVLFYQSEKLQT
ncbi:MAG: hypothetical protein MUC31_02150 [Bacteroidales bacterium]|nr:hypothetical protein [Bacteroidales bacterium]